MTCTITYPQTHGATNGSNLITACGTWNRPLGSATPSPIRVFGKLYTSGPVDAKPPPDAVPATVNPLNHQDVSNGTWHFNANPLPGAVIGASRTLMIWITADNASCFDPATPQTFTCCDATSAGCPSAPCLGESTPAPAPAGCADLTVIRTIAPRSYQVGLADAVVEMIHTAKASSRFQFPNVMLDFSLEHSTKDRAVWAGRGLVADVSLFLAVTRTSCGGLCAELTLQRLVPRGVPAPLIWESLKFDLVKGGTLISMHGDPSSASVLVITPDRGRDRVVQPGAAPERASPERPAPKPPARRTNRRTGRR
ncbi:MAG TPA: hypothetical protein VFV87_10850 [Pirellulaceae bacterium]|nr:hypothetical protein [Pirellulaceae bacterium]